MKMIRKLGAALVLLMALAGSAAAQEMNTKVTAVKALAGSAAAQEKTKVTAESKALTSLRIQVFFTEYEGENKISSMPYTLLANAEQGQTRSEANLRMGLRVPIQMQAKDSSFQYMNVGTDIDCFITNPEEGRFRLILQLRRSSLYAPPGVSADPLKSKLGQTESAMGPILRDFSGKFDLLMRDGQTVQSTLATDPYSGRVVKVDVTLTVLK